MELSTSEKIRILCNRKQITISGLAEKCGWKQTNLSNKLSRNNFAESDLRKIAEALECNLILEFCEK